MVLNHYLLLADTGIWKNSKWMTQVNERPNPLVYLVGVEFHIHQGHALVHAIVVLGNSVNCFRDVFKDQVEVKLILLCGRKEAVLECNDVGMVQQSHDLKLSVLVPFVL
jgi:hypothetical protein